MQSVKVELVCNHRAIIRDHVRVTEERILQLTADNLWQGTREMRFHSVSSFQITNTNVLGRSLLLPGTGFIRKSKK